MSGITRTTTANSLPNHVLDASSQYIAPRSVNNNQLNRMPFLALRLISSFNSAPEAAALPAVSKYLHKARDFMEPTAPALPPVCHLPRTLQQDIPQNILTHIFRFSPREEQLENPMVSKTFNQAHLRIDPKVLNVSGTKITNSELEMILLKEGDVFTHINISNCPNLKPSIIAKLAQLKTLTSLDLSRNTFTDEDLLPLTSPKVPFINPDFTDDQLHKFLNTSGDVYVHLDLKKCTKITAASIQRLAKLKQLKSIELPPKKFTNEELSPLAKKRIAFSPLKKSNIHTLNLSYCPKIRGTCFPGLGQLVRLNLRGCTNLLAVDNLGLCPKLQILILAYTKVNDKNLEVIARLKTLKKLDVSGCQTLTDKTVATFQKKITNDSLNLITQGCRKIHRAKDRVQKTGSKHHIPAPLPEDVEATDLAFESLDLYKKTLQQKRIGELFESYDGLPGHIRQVQAAISQFPKTLDEIQQRPSTVVAAAKQTLDDIRSALLKSRDGCIQSFKKGEEGSFELPYPAKHVINFPEWSGVPPVFI